MDLSNSTAQNVLDNGIIPPNGKQMYGYYGGKLYEFMPDNAGGYHGYPISGTEAPKAVLEILSDQGTLSSSQYKKFVKGQ